MEEDKHIVEYEGNDEEFEKYENIIDSPIENNIIIINEKNFIQYNIEEILKIMFMKEEEYYSMNQVILYIKDFLEKVNMMVMVRNI